MIPKKIHYCWFGRNTLPKDAIKCIKSWKKIFPDYEIIEWNEENFDVNCIPYTAQAYKAKKYAFVSDYARFKILYEHGGIYFDTDVETIKSFDDILAHGAFMGYETNPDGLKYGTVNAGLGLGATTGLQIYKSILDYYSTQKFESTDITVVTHVTNLLKTVGLTPKPGKQSVGGITIYPAEFFNPLDDATGKLNITENTHSIHWFSKSWCDQSKFRIRISRIAHRLIGTSISGKIKNLLHLK